MIRPLIALILLVVSTHIAQAQPTPEAPGKAINPPNIARGPQTPEEKAKANEEIVAILRKSQVEAEAMMKLSPEEQEKALRKMKDQMLKLTFTRSGFPDEKLQDRIIAFVAEQEKSRQKVREAATKVYLGLEKEGNPTNEQGMTILLLDYMNAADDAKDQREAATKALDKEIDFTGKPHLMALLTLEGIIGEASWFTIDVVTGSQAIGNLSQFVNAPAK